MTLSGKHAARNRVILRHLADYGGSVAKVLLRHPAIGGKGIGDMVKCLIRDGLITSDQTALPHRLALYRLTAAGCREVGESYTKSQPLGPAALNAQLATLWHCFMDEPRRYRLRSADLAHLLGDNVAPQNVPHVIAETPRASIFRVYLPTHVRQAATQLRRIVEADLANPKLGPWVESRRYGYALLVPTAHALAPTSLALAHNRLTERVETCVALGPTAETIGTALKALSRPPQS